jgi:hypothetical protein
MNLKLSTSLAVVALGALLTTNALAQNLITNPGFETPSEGSSYGNFGTGSTGITGWTVDTTPLDGVSLFSASGASGFGIANNGSQILQLCGVSYSSGGGIHQTITTVSGQVYRISIDVSYRSAAVTTGNFSFGGQNHNLSASTTTYTTLTWTVTASSASTLIDITGSTSSGANQLLIDNVSVTAVVDPGITTQPASAAGFVGGPATFSVTPSGTSPFSYQWQATNSAGPAGTFTNLVNGGQISGANTNVLNIANLTANNALGYRVIVTNVNGSITSSVASLSVVSSILLDGDCGTGGTQSGAAILGISGDKWNVFNPGTLSTVVNSLNSTMSGVSITCDTGGTAYNSGSGPTMDSGTINLMQDFVYRGPGGAAVPVSIAGLGAYNGYPFTLVVYAGMDPGQPCTESITAGATGGNTASTLNTTSATRKLSDGIGVAYQTFTGGTLSASTLTFQVAGSSYHGPNGFQLQLSDPYVVIASQPVSVTSAAGSTVNFSVSASGTALTYQWQTNGVNVGNGGIFSGATTSTLTLTAAPGSSPVNYQVVITNSFSGSVTSSVATLSLTPHISVQPAVLQATTVGGSASFSVTADGSPTLTYQWLTNGVTGATNVVGNGGAYSTATTSTLNITGATADQALTYQVVVGNTFGSVTSSPSVLTVSSSPVITVQPLSQTNNAGATVNFSVTATGAAPLAYQWQTNGVNVGDGVVVSGSATSTLTLTGISDPWALSYQVIITNSSGSATSSPALLKVIDPPVISSSPASQSVLVGSTVNFTVSTSSGTTPFTYIWQTNNGSGFATIGNGGIVSGATSATLTLTAVPTSYALDYRVILSNAAGSATSSPAATLSVHVPAFIVVQPVSETRIINQAAGLSVTAAGDATLVYQWQQTNSASGGFTNLVNGGPVSGATSSTLSISSLTANWASSYQVVVTNNYASATSSVASLSLAPSGTTSLSISNNSFEYPHSAGQQIYCSGTPGTYTYVSGWINVVNSGYWDINIPSGVTNTDGTQVLESYNGGGGVQGYIYQELTNAWIPGAVYTMTCRAGQPNGGNAAHTLDTVSIDADNGGTLTQLSYATLSNAKPGLYNYTVTYTSTGSEAGDGHPVVAYHVPSGNAVGGMWVDDYAITMSTDPLITSQPASVTNSVGSTNSFAVTAGGATLSYQWQANGGSGYTNLSNGGKFSGATSSVLTIAGATGNEAISYQVIVSNSFNVVTSTVATLSLPPAISTEPAALTALLVGGSGSLNVVADGSPTLSYQWQANGGSGYTNLTDVGAFTGSATPTLNITGATANQSLTYQVVVANGIGSVTSTPAVVAVSSSPVITVQPLSQTNNAGSTVNFSVTATGTAPLAYQWLTNGVNIGDGGIVSGSATSTLTLTGISDPWALSYSVIITNASGSATSSPAATLTVIDPPVITASPSSTSVTLGGTVNFTVTSTGSTPNYQWQTNGVNVGNGGVVSGATSSTLTLTGVTANYALNYQVILSNAAGSATSSPAATLTVNIPPSITTQPASASVALGGTNTFSVVAAGDPTLAYQWQSSPAGAGTFTSIVDNGQLSGSATSTLTVTNVDNPVLNDYRVIVSNGYGSATSSVVDLTVQLALVNVQYRGVAGETYQAGFSSSTYSGAAVFGSSGDTWNAQQIHYYTGPGSGNIISGASLVNAANAASGLTLTLAFVDIVQGASYNGTPTDLATTNLMGSAVSIYNNAGGGAGNTTTTHTIGGLSAYAGKTANLVVYAAAKNARSEEIKITGGASGGNSASTLTTSSTSRRISAGAGVAYNVFKNITLSGGNLVFTVDEPGAGGAQDSGFVNGFQLQVTTTNVPDPIVTAEPASQSALSGGTVTFNVGATGQSTLAYQWQATNASSGGFTNLTDVGIVSGSATSALTLTGVSTSLSGSSYQVIITNLNGSVTSTPALLTVLPTTQLIDVDIGTGSGTQTGAAILGQSGDAWNVVSQGTISSVFNAGNITLGGVTIGDSADGSYATPSPAVDAATAALMSDFNYNVPGNGPVPVTITGLGLYTNSVFTLVVYAGMDPGQLCTENITTGASGGNTASTLATTSATRKLSDGIGVAYNIFAGTLTNGTLTFTVSGASYHGFNGFQLLLAPSLPPLITSEPVSRTNYVGTTATFSVSALTATGTLSYQWQANGTTGFTNMVDGGVISGSQSSELTNSSVATTDGLTYQVVVSNGSGSVTSSPASLTVYTYPVAGPSFTIGATIGIPATVLIVGGKYSPTNADGLPLTITGVTGETNGTVTTDGTSVTYTATNGTTDSFTYTVSDGHSGTASQTVSVAISAAATATGFNQVSALSIGGQAVLTYLGIPGDNYALDWTHSLAYPITWTPLFTNTAAVNGYLNFTNTPSGGSDFYRTRFVP